MRIRLPAGLWQHSLMKREKLSEIDDIVNFTVHYSSKKAYVEIINLVEKLIIKEFGVKPKKRRHKIEKYKGTHFYFKYKNIPIEFIIKDKRSDISFEHKVEHSINQRKKERLKQITHQASCDFL